MGRRPKGWYTAEQRQARKEAAEARRGARKAQLAVQAAETAKREAALEKYRRAAKVRLRAGEAQATATEDRLARIARARRAEEQRLACLVFGHSRPSQRVAKPGRSKRVRMIEAPVQLEPEVERAVAIREQQAAMVRRQEAAEEATPETLAKRRAHHDSLDQMEANGSITAEQRECAAQIANVHRSIESDVRIALASLEARVDGGGSGANRVAEGVQRVRMHRAYTLWRDSLPAPKQLVLDMIVGDAIGYTVAARLHRMSHHTARKRLLAALDAWPEFVAIAWRTVDADRVEVLNAA